jgi:hypothetical protein
VNEQQTHLLCSQDLDLQKGSSAEPSTNKLFGLHYNIYLALNA